MFPTKKKENHTPNKRKGHHIQICLINITKETVSKYIVAKRSTKRNDSLKMNFSGVSQQQILNEKLILFDKNQCTFALKMKFCLYTTYNLLNFVRV